ncbi:MAG: SPOR domain-containing protein [Magnetococcales bacterium]|nr:SPOR domain-containing protein [Magnetococcales bacterium]
MSGTYPTLTRKTVETADLATGTGPGTDSMAGRNGQPLERAISLDELEAMLLVPNPGSLPPAAAGPAGAMGELEQALPVAEEYTESAPQPARMAVDRPMGPPLEPLVVQLPASYPPIRPGRHFSLVGSFTDPQETQRARDKLTSHGIASTIHESPVLERSYSHVIVGPFANGQDALVASRMIQTATGLEAIPLITADRLDASDPVDPAPALFPPNELPAPQTGRFMVLAGSFSLDTNVRLAKGLLSGHGIPSLVQAVMVGGRPFTRLLVGPFADRAQAERAVQVIKRRTEMDAVITMLDRPQQAASRRVKTPEEPKTARLSPNQPSKESQQTHKSSGSGKPASMEAAGMTVPRVADASVTEQDLPAPATVSKAMPVGLRSLSQADDEEEAPLPPPAAAMAPMMDMDDPGPRESTDPLQTSAPFPGSSLAPLTRSPASRPPEPHHDTRAAVTPAADRPEFEGRYAVLVGVFDREEDALQAIQKLSQRGIDHFLKKTTMGGRPLTQVLVGPFVEKTLARDAAALVREKTGLPTLFLTI